MSEFNEGDLVEAVKGESVVRGRVKIGTRDRGTEGYKYLGDSAAIDEVYIHDGWTVTVIERAKPALPTEPGLYRLSNRMVVQLSEFQGWLSPNDFNTVEDAVAMSATFTRLEPVAETAKKMRDRILEEFDGSLRSYADDIEFVAAEFGATGGLGE